jgi:N6-adenosine-specific RNA methylase IME4
MTIAFHRLADIFPLMEGAPFAELVADIKANGLAESIVFYESEILDGRNRYRALVEIYGEARADDLARQLSETYDRDKPLEFVISKNLKRRHLDESQRAMIAARLATMPTNRPSKSRSNDLLSQDQAATMVNVSVPSVKRATIVRDKAEPELRAAVEQGHLAVSLAAQAATLPPEQQRDIAARAVAGQANVVRTVVKQAHRAQRERDLGARQCALPDKRYGLIVADPEWQFVVRSRKTGLDRSADNHYPTSDLEIIKDRPVASIAADDAVLWLWSTVPFLAHAIDVMRAWEFEYKSHIVWPKGRLGNGYLVRNVHELVLIGTRGHPPAPAPGMQPPSLIEAPRGEHSAKPEVFLEWAERLYPSLPKIELNRRGPPRPGWDAWGNEAEAAA